MYSLTDWYLVVFTQLVFNVKLGKDRRHVYFLSTKSLLWLKSDQTIQIWHLFDQISKCLAARSLQRKKQKQKQPQQNGKLNFQDNYFPNKSNHFLKMKLKDLTWGETMDSQNQTTWNDELFTVITSRSKNSSEMELSCGVTFQGISRTAPCFGNFWTNF